MKIAIVTDAFPPQINGVVNTLFNLSNVLEKQGHSITWFAPHKFKTIPMPFYPSIKIAWNIWNLSKLLDNTSFDAIHIATEGPLGFSASRWCKKNNVPYTTSYHTKFDDYLNQKLFIPKSWIFRYLLTIHSSSQCILTTTPSMSNELIKRGLFNVKDWGRGVDTSIFSPLKRSSPNPFVDMEKPIWLNVGRVSQEKNLTSFLNVNVPGTKIIIGDGPDLNKLRKKYNNAIFLGSMPPNSEELAKHYAHADIFVFPSKTDTFGLVILEALSSGLPVAAYPVTGPIDIIESEVTGFLSNNLQLAMESCLSIDNHKCREYALTKHSWDSCADIFVASLVKKQN